MQNNQTIIIKKIKICNNSGFSKLHKELIQLRKFRTAIKKLCFQWETVDEPWTDKEIIGKCRDLIDVCAGCDVADRMRELVYLVSNGMMSYANYTYEAIESVYYEELEKQIDDATKEIEKEKEELSKDLEILTNQLNQSKD